MATRRLPATPILLFLVSNHCRSSTYIHKHQCARETVVKEYKGSNDGINMQLSRQLSSSGAPGQYIIWESSDLD